MVLPSLPISFINIGARCRPVFAVLFLSEQPNKVRYDGCSILWYWPKAVVPHHWEGKHTPGPK